MLERYWNFDLQLFADDDTPPDDTTNTGDPDKDQKPAKSYDEDYVKGIRQESAKHRTRVKELESQMQKMPQEITAKVLAALGLEPDPNKNYEQQLAEANRKAQEAEERATKRLIKAEVTKVSTELGIIDSDAAMALMDSSQIKVNDADDVEGVKEALEALIKDKPYLKGQPNTEKSVGRNTNPANTEDKKSEGSMNNFIRRSAGVI